MKEPKVRIDPKLKWEAKLFTVQKNITLTELINWAIKDYINKHS